MRVLSGEDFAAPHEASRHLRTVRSHGTEMDDLVEAMRGLCALAPRAHAASIVSKRAESGG